jgi:hypothetical protein
MDDGIELSAVEPAEQVGRRHHIRDLTLGEIAPLAVAAEHVIDGDIGPPGLVQGRDHIRANKPGPACDQKHPRPAVDWVRPSFARLRGDVQLGGQSFGRQA